MKTVFILVICLCTVTASHSECTDYEEGSDRNAGEQETTIRCDRNYDHNGHHYLKMIELTCNNLSPEINYICIKCNATDQEELFCKVYIDSASQPNPPNCENPYCDCEPHCPNTNTQITTTKVTSDSDDVSSTTVSEANTDGHNSASVFIVLGTLVGLLVLLVVVTTTGWIWACLLMRNRGRMNFSSEPVRSSIDQLNNPTYEGDDLLRLQPPVPAYETIELHPRNGNDTESSQQDEDGYRLLNRNQRKGATNVMSRGLETIHENWKEESYSKLEQTTVSNNGPSQGQGGEYSNLETLTVKLDTTEEPTTESTIGEGETDGVSQTENNRTMPEEDNSDDDALQLENGNSQNGQDKAEAVSQPMVNTAMDSGHTGNKPTKEDPETDCDQVTSSFKLNASEDDA